MSAPTGRDTALYLPDVETRHQPGTYHDLIAAARAQGAEYSKIWDLFAFQQSFTIHMGRFTQGVLRQPATISAALRELIAAYTSYQNQCAFCTQAHAAAASELYNDDAWCGRPFAISIARRSTTRRSCCSASSAR
jgi:alkylhydroperoxidase/carboxymuconolactone decarboxylase family protein YurZ